MALRVRSSPAKKPRSKQSPSPRKSNAKTSPSPKKTKATSNIASSSLVAGKGKKRVIDEPASDVDASSKKRRETQTSMYGEVILKSNFSSGPSSSSGPVIDILAQSSGSGKQSSSSSSSSSSMKSKNKHLKHLTQQNKQPFFGRVKENKTSDKLDPKHLLKNKKRNSRKARPLPPITKEPRVQDPLMVHIKYHLENCWGIPWRWLKFMGKSLGFIAGLIMLNNTLHYSAYLMGGLAIPVPLIRVNVLFWALLDPHFGIPSLFTLNNFISLLSLVMITVVLFFVMIKLPHQLMTPIYFKFMSFFSGLQAREKFIAGRPVSYLECGAGHVSGHEGKPTVLLIHDAFGRAHDWQGFVRSLQDKFHVLIPDLPAHGQHIIGPRPDLPFSPQELEVDNLAHFLARFKVDVLGATRVHHVIAIGYGSCIAMKYASMDVISEYVASLTFISPFGIEPLSENFHHVYSDPEQLITRMSANPTYLRMHQKRTASPAWQPAFYHKGRVAEWSTNRECRLALAKILFQVHEQGELHSSLQLEDTGRPILVIFGNQDTLAKSFGQPLEMEDLQVANINVQFANLVDAGHDMLHESSRTVSELVGLSTDFVLRQHEKLSKKVSYAPM